MEVVCFILSQLVVSVISLSQRFKHLSHPISSLKTVSDGSALSCDYSELLVIHKVVGPLIGYIVQGTGFVKKSLSIIRYSRINMVIVVLDVDIGE